MPDYLVLKFNPKHLAGTPAGDNPVAQERAGAEQAADWEPALIVLDAQNESEAVEQAYGVGGQAVYKVVEWPDDKEFHAIASAPEVRERSTPRLRQSEPVAKE